MAELTNMTAEEKQLVQLLADMMEDEALPIANRMLLEEKKDPMRVLELRRKWMGVAA